MDFYVNGNINGVVEVQRNSTKARTHGKGGSQDINEHMDRLVSGKYPFTTFVMLNFAMNPQAEVVLPDDPIHHDRVFTYQRNTNKLFRGLKEIKSPAVNKLICPFPLGGAPGSTGPAQPKSVKPASAARAARLVRSIHTLCRIW